MLILWAKKPPAQLFSLLKILVSHFITYLYGWHDKVGKVTAIDCDNNGQPKIAYRLEPNM